MKILSIGNSFSQDAHKWLHEIASNHGMELETANLYIGGCSLQTHWENLVNDNAHYELEWNGGAAERLIRISEAFTLRDWDIVTVQQVSNLSGMPDSYEPYLSQLADAVHQALPQAKLCFHQTWAYETDSSHGGFVSYNCDQRLMYRRILETTRAAAERIHAAVIPAGTVIQHVREHIPAFAYGNGGLSLCRDGFHLSWDYGRYLAAAVWFRTLTGKPLTVTRFRDFDPALLAQLHSAVNDL